MKKILLATALILAPAVAQATQMQCRPYDEVAELLTGGFGEVLLERGLDHRGTMAEWWGNRETGTWSLVTVQPNGVACIPAYGQAFESIEPAALGTDS